MGAKPFGQRVPRLARPGEEDALAPQVAPRGQRPHDRFGHVARRRDVRRHAATGERRRRGWPDCRDGDSAELARGASPISQAAAYDVYSVLAREHDPVVAGEVGQGSAQGPEVRERLDPDGGGGDDLGAERGERVNQLGGLLARAGDHDAPPGKGAQRQGLPRRL